LQSLVLK